MRRLLASFSLTGERKWGKATYALQGFKEYVALGFFRGALLSDPKHLLVQPGRTQAARVIKFTSVREIVAQARTIKTYVREAIALERASLRVQTTPPDWAVPEELKMKFRREPKLKRAFAALTSGRRRS